MIVNPTERASVFQALIVLVEQLQTTNNYQQTTNDY